ncbi:MAG: hypothetical protein A2566_03075 [Candidatus Zambryskibacteria bacterium RIFOXYD1_FULL_40_13]|nr:MAG: hypothetical protein UT25_C0002G0073 [Parcubacteria group bacterium GW2011_GWC1_39_12]KKR19428.1 MAG: hypothetical protein UT49_C0002G0274 [Parcubacteria group bacterium GW2011_GWF1_39_37]KKR35054.1 MAG: hypothetical protein UT68_C0005G0003 [Parcubacteria group bacterium GW2011_GWC2_40_10]KKR52377.1 MAG: hypothetical protein UT89_C0002G0178 [Parcubacteria group bacterium GW2011_GWE1_40_20]KKR65465.1 MAG: hypothetical protein UU06_C0018G0008 [Parcubacteria group bacterium GW2011_GWB1_40_
MTTIICSKCKILKPIEDFNFKIKSKGIYQRQCKICTRTNIRNHYIKNKKYYLNKAQKRNLGLRTEINKYILDYFKNHHCIDCGESDPVVLEFDHRDRSEKDAHVSGFLRAMRLDMVKSEIEKCDVRCANCHRKRTAKQFHWFKLINTKNENI